MMHTVQIPKGVAPCQVEDFPEGCERSQKGALYFRPNGTMRLTEDEYKHVLKSHPELGGKMLLVHKGETAAEKKAKAQAEAKAKPAPKAKVEAKAEVAEEAKERPKQAKKQKAQS